MGSEYSPMPNNTMMTSGLAEEKISIYLVFFDLLTVRARFCFVTFFETRFLLDFLFGFFTNRLYCALDIPYFCAICCGVFPACSSAWTCSLLIPRRWLRAPIGGTFAARA